MSDYKPEILPSGVLIRKIKDDNDRFVLSSEGQAIIVSKLDIARMDGIVYPTKRLSERCSIAPKIEASIDAEQAWQNVEQKLTTQDVQELTNAYEAEVRRIAEILAKIEYDKHGPFQFVLWDNLDTNSDGFMGDGYYKDIKQCCIEDHIPMARAIMMEMANVAKDFHHAGWTNRGAYDHPAPAAKVGQLDYLLIKRGLIPSPENEQK